MTPFGMPDNLCTDPTSDQFMAGATFEYKAATLKHVSPARYGALEVLLDQVLRHEFKQIGRAWTAKPNAAREDAL